MDLKNDLRLIAIEALDAAGAKFDRNAVVEELLLAALTIEERRIVATPRNVHVSAIFEKARMGLSPDEAGAVAEIIRKLSVGEDINAHLNRRSLQPSANDDLLVEWGIHHFHLSTIIPSGDRFVERTGPLAFAHINRQNVYFVDILPHNNFSEPMLVETLIREFPVVAEANRIRGIQALSHPAPATSADVAALRKTRVNTFREIGGDHYFGPGPGFVASGHSVRAVMRMNKTFHELRRLELSLEKNMPQVLEAIAKVNPALKPADLNFALWDGENEWLIVEKNTDMKFRFTSAGR